MKNSQKAFIFVWDNPAIIESCLSLGQTLLSMNLEPIFITRFEESKRYISKNRFLHIALESITDSFSHCFNSWYEINKNNSVRNRKYNGINLLELLHYEYLCISQGFNTPIGIKYFFPLIKKALLYWEAFEFLLNKYKPYACYIWNGLVIPPKILKVLCLLRNIPIFSLERGLLPGFMVIDSRGINYCGELGGESWKSISPQIPENELNFVRNYLVQFRESGKSIVNSDYTKLSRQQILKKLNIPSNYKIILIPNQIDYDTNIILFSGGFSSNKMVTQSVLDSIKEIKNLFIIVKSHPEDSELDLTGIRELLGTKGAILQDVNLHSLINLSSLVVVRNSTVGLEALMYEKPVICLGQSAYSNKGFTYDVNDMDQLRETICSIVMSNSRRIQEKKLTGKSFYSFIYYLLNMYHFKLSKDIQSDVYNKKILLEKMTNYNARKQNCLFSENYFSNSPFSEEFYLKNLECNLLEEEKILMNIYNSKGWKTLKKYYVTRDSIKLINKKIKHRVKQSSSDKIIK